MMSFMYIDEEERTFSFVLHFTRPLVFYLVLLYFA